MLVGDYIQNILHDLKSIWRLKASMTYTKLWFINTVGTNVSYFVFLLFSFLGVKPFECLTCGVAWADARSLKRHVRTHTGERPYVCPVCNEAYIDARNLRKHMTKYHSNYIPCKIMLEKDSLQFHHQGTQVEHAVSFVPNELVEAQPEIIDDEEVDTELVSGNVEDSEEAEDVTGSQEGASVSSLSDQSIMQVVNYVLAHQGTKLEATDQIDTVEVEVSEVL